MAYQETMVSMLSDSKALQLFTDNVAETFEPSVHSKYLTDKFTLDLDWKGVMAVLSNSPAASVIDFSSGKPLAVRPAISKLSGELISFGNKYQMTKKDVRDFLNLQDNLGRMGIDINTLIDFLVPDVKRATMGPHKTIDRLLLEALSTGIMTLTVTNNPKGVIWNTALDWGITKSFTSVLWATSATAKPLTEIRTKINARRGKGIPTGNIKMSRATYVNLCNTAEFLAGYKFNVGSTTAINNAFLGEGSVNIAMVAMGLPMIEIMEDSIDIELKDGSTSSILPFADGRVTFSPDNNYGQLLYSYANEQRRPVAGKTYAVAQNVLISKYQDNDGQEFTESEFNAFPVLNAANHLDILVTDALS
jgi:hypothetical protein